MCREFEVHSLIHPDGARVQNWRFLDFDTNHQNTPHIHHGANLESVITSPMNVPNSTQDDQRVSLTPLDHPGSAVASEPRHGESLHDRHTTSKNQRNNEADDHPFHPSIQPLLSIQPSASLPRTSTDQTEASHWLETAIHQAFSDWHGKTTRPWQLEACIEVLQRHTIPTPTSPLRPLLLVRSTGGGKSSVRDVCGFLCGGITLTIVPLLSLSADQTEKLLQVVSKQELSSRVRVFNLDVVRSRNVNFTLRYALESLAKNPSSKTRVMLFSSPQKIANDPSWQKTLVNCARRGALRLVAIDECHLYAGHGIEFRQEFGALQSTFINKLQKVSVIPIPLLFMTATALLSMVNDLQLLTGLSFDPQSDFLWPFHHSGVQRRNIFIDITFKDSPLRRVKADLVSICRTNGNRKLIVYSNSRKGIMHLHQEARMEFNRLGIQKDIVLVHGNMYREQKFHNTELFAGQPLVATCPHSGRELRFNPAAYFATAATTSAGLDCHEVDKVLFHGFPPTLEDLLQCSGRCGRSPTATPETSSFCMVISLNSFVSLLTRIFILPKYAATQEAPNNTILETAQPDSTSESVMLRQDALAKRQWQNALQVLRLVCLDDGTCVHYALEQSMLHPHHESVCDLQQTCGGVCWRCRVPRISTPLDAPVHKGHLRSFFIAVFITNKLPSSKLVLHKDVFLNSMIDFEIPGADGKPRKPLAKDVLGLKNNRTVRQRTKAVILKCFAAGLLESDVDGLVLKAKLGYCSNGNPRLNDDLAWKGFRFLDTT